MACGIFSCGLWTLSCGIWDLVPWPEIKSRLHALGVQILNHWTTKEVLLHLLYSYCFTIKFLFINFLPQLHISNMTMLFSIFLCLSIGGSPWLCPAHQLEFFVQFAGCLLHMYDSINSICYLMKTSSSYIYVYIYMSLILSFTWGFNFPDHYTSVRYLVWLLFLLLWIILWWIYLWAKLF